jgi:hypothetical protein
LRCALFESNAFHGEVLPPWVHLLNCAGVAVDVYASSRILKNDPFSTAPNLQFTPYPAGTFARSLSSRRYEFIVLNSTEPETVLESVQKLDLPVVGTVHNADLLNTPPFSAFFDVPRRAPVMLAEHIWKAYGNGRGTWIFPAVLAPPDLRQRGFEARRFCVQGNVEFSRRNYDALIDAVDLLRTDGCAGLTISVIGRNHISDGKTLKKKIKARALEKLFEFSRRPFYFRDIPFESYYQGILRCQFVLPLVDHSREAYAPYFSKKLTSSLPVAVGLGRVPVLHRDLAALYGILDASVHYLDGGLAEAMRTALALSHEGEELMRRKLEAARELALQRSRSNLKDLLDSLFSN